MSEASNKISVVPCAIIFRSSSDSSESLLDSFVPFWPSNKHQVFDDFGGSVSISLPIIVLCKLNTNQYLFFVSENIRVSNLMEIQGIVVLLVGINNQNTDKYFVLW